MFVCGANLLLFLVHLPYLWANVFFHKHNWKNGMKPWPISTMFSTIHTEKMRVKDSASFCSHQSYFFVWVFQLVLIRPAMFLGTQWPQTGALFGLFSVQALLTLQATFGTFWQTWSGANGFQQTQLQQTEINSQMSGLLQFYSIPAKHSKDCTDITFQSQ